MKKSELVLSQPDVRQPLLQPSKRKTSLAAKSGSRRERQRARLLYGDSASLTDLEILEMILWLGESRTDMRPLAIRTLALFGSIDAVHMASHEKLSKSNEWRPHFSISLKLVAAAEDRLGAPQSHSRARLSDWCSLKAYLKTNKPDEKRELRLLFLNSKNFLLADQIQPYPTNTTGKELIRQIACTALNLKAAALILVTDCKIADVNPSPEQVTLTKEIWSAVRALSISFHDHVVLSSIRSEPFSFRRAGLL